MDCTENTEKNKETIIKSIKNRIPLMINDVNAKQVELNHIKFLDIIYNNEMKDCKDKSDWFRSRAEEAKMHYDNALKFAK
jgi:uncharacterized ferritin-like protein (DUF455 family)